MSYASFPLRAVLAEFSVPYPSLRNQASFVASINSWKGAVRLQKEVDAFEQTVYDAIVRFVWITSLSV